MTPSRGSTIALLAATTCHHWSRRRETSAVTIAQSTSLLTHLQCSACGRTYEADEPRTVCPACGKVLLARYDLDRARATLRRDDVASRPGSLWRYAELLPVRDPANVVTLGEGWTPLLRADRLG